MEVRLLCIGDVVGRPGRHVLSHVLPKLVKERQIDCVIANVENAAGGSGLTPQLYEKFQRYGVHIQTLGDHALRRHQIYPVLERSDKLVRPGNLPKAAPGRGSATWTSASGLRVGVVTVLGRIFMKPPADCPFETADRLLEEMPADVRVRVVEFHAEATSEKIAMGWHLDGRASVVFGTHTHVPTGDECVLPNGTAYITDLGMTGPYDSVLGRRKDEVIHHLRTSVPMPFAVATGNPCMSGIIATVDSESGKAQAIERVRMSLDTETAAPLDDRED